MADKPIIFSGPMVNALLAGRKTQTRRIIRDYSADDFVANDSIMGPKALRIAAKFRVGDRLWVREQCATWGDIATDAAYRATMGEADWTDLLHDAKNGAPWKVRTSIHMPRWASRLTLIVTDVRVQRLQDISEADAMADGVDAVTMDDVPRQATMSRRSDFAAFWNSLHGPQAWGANPWVVALTFTVHKCNIDSMEAAA